MENEESLVGANARVGNINDAAAADDNSDADSDSNDASMAMIQYNNTN